MVIDKGHKLLWIFMLLILFSCEEGLDIESPNANPGYFVECYMRPGELYNLTATQIQPIFEDYILDYSYDFDAYVIDEDTNRMYQSLFVEPETGFIYNFGSPERLYPELEEVKMLVISPNQDTLTASTTIPEQVSLESAIYSDNMISLSFYSSTSVNQNFYIAIVNYTELDKEEKEIMAFDIKYLEFADTESQVLQKIEFENSLYSSSEDLKLTLMRVTEENYNYQISLEDAKSAGTDNITFPAPLAGNIENGIGIFTAYTEDVIEF